MCERELALLREAIRNERKDKRITQEELAEMLEVSPTHVKHIESGHRKPSVELLFRMVQLLDISLDAVLLDKTQPKRVLYLDGLTDREAEAIENLIALFKKQNNERA